MDICPHINSIKVDAIKKKLPTKLAYLNTCDSCQMLEVYKPKGKKKKGKGKAQDGNHFDRLDICLSCITLSCGEDASLKHSRVHYKDKKHPIVVNTLTLDLY